MEVRVANLTKTGSTTVLRRLNADPQKCTQANQPQDSDPRAQGSSNRLEATEMAISRSPVGQLPIDCASGSVPSIDGFDGSPPIKSFHVTVSTVSRIAIRFGRPGLVLSVGVISAA
jgi:hypothetical protein